MLEIDIDVRRLVALLRDEALEEQLRPDGIDGGDVEHVAHRGIGRRPSPLTQNVTRARKVDDGVDGEKIRRVAKRFDQPQLMPQLGRHPRRNACRISAAGAHPGEAFEFLLRGFAFVGFGGILIGQFIEREAAAPHDLGTARDRFGMTLEQAHHFVRILQETIGMPFETEACGIDGAALADAGHHILQHASIGMMIEDVTERDRRDFLRLSGLLHLPETQMFVRTEPADQRHIGPVPECSAQAPEIDHKRIIRVITQKHRDEPFVPDRHIVPA